MMQVVTNKIDVTTVDSPDVQNEKIREERRRLFIEQCDSLFFQSQRSEIDTSVWLQACEDVRLSLPLVEE